MDEARFKMLAQQTARIFFLHQEKENVLFTPLEKKYIIHNAFSDHAQHVENHSINQCRLDIFKLYGFLGYKAADIKKTESSTVKDVCQNTINRMSVVLELETSKRVILKDEHKEYLTSMLSAELLNNSTFGVGANGIGAVFAFMVKSYKFTVDWDINEAAI